MEGWLSIVPEIPTWQSLPKVKSEALLKSWLPRDFGNLHISGRYRSVTKPARMKNSLFVGTSSG
jgi:hypothetical protein